MLFDIINTIAEWIIKGVILLWIFVVLYVMATISITTAVIAGFVLVVMIWKVARR